MKKIVIYLLCFMMCVTGIVGITLAAQQPAVMPASMAEEMTVGNKITVSGVGEIKLIPDLAIVSVGVDSLNDSLGNAQKDNATSIQNIIAFLKDYGITEDNIKTKNFNVYQRYDYSNGEKFIGYQVSNYLDFKTKDVDNVGMIVSKLMENGANRFSGITFTLENYEEAYKLALNKALENAKNKISALTENEYKVVEINEENSYNFYARDNYMCVSSEKEVGSIMKGEITIKANVKVVFAA